MLVQYAEKSFPQMKTIAKKNAMVQQTTMKSMDQVTQLKVGAFLLVKIRRYRRMKLDFTRPSAGTCSISTGQNAYHGKKCRIGRDSDCGRTMFAFGFPTAVLGSGAGYPSSLRPTSNLLSLLC